MKCTVILAMVLYLAEMIASARILIYIALGAPSHLFTILPYANTLVKRGHNVTVISSMKSTHGNYEEIVPSAFVAANKGVMSHNAVHQRLSDNILTYNQHWFVMSQVTCQGLLDSPEVRDIITGRQQFDLIILDPLCNECGLGLIHSQKVPLVYFNTASLYQWHTTTFGLPSTAIFWPSFHVFRINDVTKFTHRLVIATTNMLYTLLRHYYLMPKLQMMWERALGENISSFSELESNVSLSFVNSHPSVEAPFPYAPNIIEVGGIHLQEQQKALPKEWDVLATGLEGVGFIIVSLGSIVQPKTLPPEYYKIFLEVFSRLPQQILWKGNPHDLHDDLRSIPSNVLFRKWIPQRDLLGHPKCRAFVSHGGRLSTLEAVSAGVPMVVIPFFADQDINADAIQSAGFGVRLDISEVTVTTLFSAITSIMNDSGYKMMAQRRSELLRDQLETPMQRAIYWTEFVIRHGGAPHLAPSRMLRKWYQYHLIDVWGFIVIFLLSLAGIMVYIFTCILTKSVRNLTILKETTCPNYMNNNEILFKMK